MKGVIPVKPFSINKAWQGRRFMTREYKGFVEECLLTMGKKEMLPARPLRVELRFYMKNPRQVDVDNLVKPVLDVVVKAGWIADDRWIYDLRAVKIKSKDERIETLIEKVYES